MLLLRVFLGLGFGGSFWVKGDLMQLKGFKAHILYYE